MAYYGMEILLDSSLGKAEKLEIEGRVCGVCRAYMDPSFTNDLSHNAEYSAGSSSVRQVTISVGGSSPDFGIDIRASSSTADDFTDKDWYSLVAKIKAALSDKSLTLTNAASYTEGDRAYNTIIQLSAMSGD